MPSRARFSEVLANRRRQLGLTIPQAAQVLRLRADVLEAFESGDFSRMPTSGYAQGMLSSYARYLDLNPSEIVDMFSEELNEYQRRSARGGSSADDADGWGNGSGERYPQGRPYTARAPYESRSRDRRQTTARRNALRRGERSYAENGGYEYDRYDAGTGNISTMRFDEGRYEDDLGFTNDAQPYHAASTPEGRTYRNGYQSAGRPNVQRREPSTTRRRVRTSSRSSRANGRRRGRMARFFDDPVHAFGAIALAVIIILTVVIIFSVSSCVSTALGDNSKSVAVSTTQSGDSTSGSGTSSTDEREETAREQLSAVDNTSTDTSTDTKVSVTVSVADGAVTWLEVDNDGTSDVADTVTGPWERTYNVTDSITIQAHDTSSVTVTRNGKQVQFDTLAGGVGTLTIKGSGATASDFTDADTSTADSSSSGSGASGTSTQGSAQSTTGSGSSTGTSASTSAQGSTTGSGSPGSSASSSGTAASGGTTSASSGTGSQGGSRSSAGSSSATGSSGSATSSGTTSRQSGRSS